METAPATIDSPTPQTSERTGKQTGGGAVLEPVVPYNDAPLGKLNTYRDMLADDTVALGLAMVQAPVLGAGWSVEAEDDAPEGAAELIEDQVGGHVEHYKRAALHGGLCFGWAPFEKVFEVVAGEGGPRIGLRKLKPLLHDITQILQDIGTGNFEGFKQTSYNGDSVAVPLPASLLFTHDREGDNLYGRPRLENSRKAWHRYNQAEDGAARYDRKVAGAYVIVHYPRGKTQMADGTEKDNFEVAKLLAAGLESCKPVAIENAFSRAGAAHPPDKELKQWQFELLSDSSSKQDSFKTRLEYLDKKKLRGLYVPERSALEGQNGTKAEAEVHTDIILATGEQLYEQIIEVLNWHVVDQLLALNYGDEARGTVRVTPAPLVDAARSLLVKLIEGMMSSDGGVEWLRGNVDLIQTADRLGMPLLPEDQRSDSDLVPTGPAPVGELGADQLANQLDAGSE